MRTRIHYALLAPALALGLAACEGEQESASNDMRDEQSSAAMPQAELPAERERMTPTDPNQAKNPDGEVAQPVPDPTPENDQAAQEEGGSPRLGNPQG